MDIWPNEHFLHKKRSPCHTIRGIKRSFTAPLIPRTPYDELDRFSFISIVLFNSLALPSNPPYSLFLLYPTYRTPLLFTQWATTRISLLVSGWEARVVFEMGKVERRWKESNSHLRADCFPLMWLKNRLMWDSVTVNLPFPFYRSMLSNLTLCLNSLGHCFRLRDRLWSCHSFLLRMPP